MEKVKVVLWGLGSMGSGMGRILADREGIEIAGGIASRKKKSGQDLGELFGLDYKLGVAATNNPEEALTEEVDVVLHGTSSFLTDIKEELDLIISRGINVISIAEEMAYPQAGNPEFASWLADLAQEKGVTVLGTGINPGFVLDHLIITLTGACASVDKIEASRVNDLSPFGPTVMKTQGVGTTVEEFKTGVAEGKIVGHIGFRESIKMIADRIGLSIDEIKETREPIISETHRETEHVKVEPGMVAGCKHIARGFNEGQEVIVLEPPQQIHPGQEGTETGDYIKIIGEPEVNMAIQPEIPGGTGTMAVAVNMIPQVINAEAGLKTMADLPTPGVVKSDIRDLLKK